MSLFSGIEIPGHPCLENCRKIDLLAIPFIRRCHRLGFAIDKPYLADLSVRFGHQITELEREIALYIPREKLHEFTGSSLSAGEVEDEEGYSDGRAEFNASSPEQIGKLLFDTLGIGRGKQLKRTNKGQIGTGKKQLELVKNEHEIIPKVLRHRELTKLKTTYADKLPRLARFHPKGYCQLCELTHRSESWRVHGEMGTTRAETGRINHKNPNLGNIPTRTPDGQAVQAGFIAPEGCVLVANDLSQIELRGLAHLANAQSMIEVYQNGGDIHDRTSRLVFRLPDDVKPDKIKHRMASKRANFGIQNGTTAGGLYMQLVMDYGANNMPIPDWLTEEWCQWFIEQWLDSYPEVRAFFDLSHYRARRYGMNWDLFGRVRLIPEVRSTHSWIREAGLRQSQNMPVTATAAEQLKLSMGKADLELSRFLDAGYWCWPLLTIHDAIMVECEEEVGEEMVDILNYAMNTCMTDEQTGEHRFRVPIESDGDMMKRWVKADGWKAKEKYKVGEKVLHESVCYRSLKSDNQGNEPVGTGGEAWEEAYGRAA